MAAAMSGEDAAVIFAAVKDAASKKAWAKGVALARNAQLAFARSDGEDQLYHVTTPSNGVTVTSMVNPGQEDWHCSCGDNEDPCHHVVALVIGLQQADGQIAAPAAESLRLGYFFSQRSSGGRASLHVDRGFYRTSAPNQDISWVPGTLKAAANKPSAAAHKPSAAIVETADLELDPWLCHLGLSREGGEPIPATSMTSVFALLTAHDLPAFWEGQPITLKKEPYPEVIAIKDQGDGVTVALSSSGAAQRFANGAVLGADGGLWLPPKSTASELPVEASWLRQGRVFKAYELVYLASELLPQLGERFSCHNSGQNLPRLVQERPRPAFYCEAEGDQLSITPKLIYGDPPIARVDKKALILEGRDCPQRDRNREYALTDAMGRKLAMVPGDCVTFTGKKALAMAAAIQAFAKERRGLLFSRHPATGRWRQDRQLTASEGPLTGIGQFKTHPPLTPHISLGASDFKVSFQLPSSEGLSHQDPGHLNHGSEVPAAAVFEAFRDGQSTLALPGGGFAPLPVDWFQRYGPLLAQLWEAKQQNDGQLPRSLWPSYQKLATALDATFTASEQVTALAADLSAAAPSTPLPRGVKATLRPYQQEGFAWLKLRQRHQLGAILADDMGLGKTLQTICVLPNEGLSLVVCPTSVLFNWQNELQTFRPSLKAGLYHGSQRDLPALRASGCHVILTSYGTLRRDQDALSEVRWGMVVLDEAQTIKNPSSQVSGAAYRLKAKFKLALTGTPIENSLLDLWSQFHFLLPGFLGNHKPFAASLGSANESQQVAVIKEQIAPYILRRTKKQVLTDLPDKIESLLYYELSAEERERYEALFAASQPKVQKLLLGGGKLEILEIILRLRQACCHPQLGSPAAKLAANPAPSPNSSPAEPEGKLRPLLAKLAQIKASRGGKSLIFSQWTGFLAIIERRLKQEGYITCRLDGQTTDRGGVVASFQDDPAVEVMLISLKAGSTGLNLTAAENVFIMDPWWNPASENQAADRAYRIGQKNTVQVFRIVAIDTIEENIVLLKDAKQKLADAAISEDGGTPPAADIPDLASLFTRDTRHEL